MRVVEILDFSEDGDLWVVYPWGHYRHDAVRAMVADHLRDLEVLDEYVDYHVDGDVAAALAELTVRDVWGVQEDPGDAETRWWFQTEPHHPSDRVRVLPLTLATWEPTLFLDNLPAVEAMEASWHGTAVQGTRL